MSQEQLADLIGISRVQVSRVENGKRKYDQYFLEQASVALGCTPADLLACDPFNADGLFSLYEQLSPQQRRQLVAIGRTFLDPRAVSADYLQPNTGSAQKKPNEPALVEDTTPTKAKRRR